MRATKPVVYMGGDGELRMRPGAAYAVELDDAEARRLGLVAGRMDVTPGEALLVVIRAGLAALRRPNGQAVRS